MAGAFVEVDSRAAEAALARLAAATGDVTPALIEIGNSLIQSHHARWARHVDADGRGWTPLSPRYLRYKKKNRDRILILDGFLHDLLHYQVDPDQLDFGTSMLYGATHQFGDPRRNIPARPFLGISIEDQQEITEILSEHLSRALG